MTNRDILAIGTSAGGVEALLFLARQMPREFPASILVTIHLSRQFRSSLDELLSNAGMRSASFAVDGEPLRKGHIFIAPTDQHLIVDKDRLRLGAGPQENNARPAIDPMMRSAAVCCGPRTVGVVLTGTLGDGASGLWALSQCGGLTAVQDPNDATFSEMPFNALKRVAPDHVVRLAEMPALLTRLAHLPAGDAMPVSGNLKFEVEIARTGRSAMDDMDHIGSRSTLACPDCHGVMWEIGEGELTRYRCHVGHTYTAELMALALDENLRRALASAQRALEERVMLARKLHDEAREHRQKHLAANWERKAREFDQELVVIRKSIRRIEEIAGAARQQDNAEAN
jgi:two-component system chemotaxis response regulator CheB